MSLASDQIILALFWVAVMLTYLLGDVIRIFAGEFQAGEIDGEPMSQKMWFMIAVIMVVPILMIVVTLVLPQGVNRWINMIVSLLFILMNALGLKGYKPFDRFLLIISMLINVGIIYLAWMWQ